MIQVRETFKTDQGDCPAIVFKPDVMPAGKKFPLILFLHGWGEAAKSGPLDLVLRYGPPKYLNQGFNIDAIVVCPQAPDFSYQFNAVRFILNDVFGRYPIDKGSIHGTGISAGGGGIWSCVTNPGKVGQWAPIVPEIKISNLFSTIVPLSSMYVPQGYEDPFIENVAAEAGVAVWSIAGDKDVKFSEQATYIKRILANNPQKLPVALTGIPGADHTPAAWDTASDPAAKLQPFNCNIYDFMFKNAKALRSQPAPLPDPQPAPIPSKTVVREFTITKSIVLNLQLWSDGTVTEK